MTMMHEVKTAHICRSIEINFWKLFQRPFLFHSLQQDGFWFWSILTNWGAGANRSVGVSALKKTCRNGRSKKEWWAKKTTICHCVSSSKFPLKTCHPNSESFTPSEEHVYLVCLSEVIQLAVEDQVAGYFSRLEPSEQTVVHSPIHFRALSGGKKMRSIWCVEHSLSFHCTFFLHIGSKWCSRCPRQVAKF